MRELNQQEIDEVAGAWGLPGAVIGAVSGAAMYMGSSLTSGDFSGRELATATAVGAALGFVSGPMSMTRAYFYPRASALGGAIEGYMSGC